LDEFKYGGTNITAFRLVDPDNLEVQQTVYNWTFGEAKLGKKLEFGVNENGSVIKAETALMYDAVHLFAKALHDLDTSQQIDIHPLSCDTQDTWPHGYSLINYMKIVSITHPVGNKIIPLAIQSDIPPKIRPETFQKSRFITSNHKCPQHF
jgi:ionotropic glutamate receptor